VPGHWELIALVFVLLLLFGSKQIPQIARQLGRGMREVKQTVADVDPREDVKRSLDTKPIQAPDDESSAER
jgi:sec-independent protein translocase protein TatA